MKYVCRYVVKYFFEMNSVLKFYYIIHCDGVGSKNCISFVMGCIVFPENHKAFVTGASLPKPICVWKGSDHKIIQYIHFINEQLEKSLNKSICSVYLYFQFLKLLCV